MASEPDGRFLTRMLGLAADTLIIYIAASLTRPVQPVLQTFAAAGGTVVLQESGASLEHARKITELGRIPDVLLLADAEVFPQLLMPAHATWYAEFARNRMVIAYTAKSKHANDINASNWTRILSRKDVEVGRTDPDQAPVGYRTLLLMQLAERHYHAPGLAASLLANAPARNVRPNAASLAALLAAGELDYIYEYQSVAESNGFSFVALPPSVDLGDPDRAAEYAKASTRVRGATPGSSHTVVGQPIVYGLSIPKSAPHAAVAARFLAYLSSAGVVKQLRQAHVDMLEHPIVVGSGAPKELSGASGSSAPRRP